MVQMCSTIAGACVVGQYHTIESKGHSTPNLRSLRARTCRIGHIELCNPTKYRKKTANKNADLAAPPLFSPGN